MIEKLGKTCLEGQKPRSTSGHLGLVLILMLLCLLGTVSIVERASATVVQVYDFRGHSVILPRHAQRIVCLIESALSGLYMLGVGDRVVGVSTNVYESSVRPYYEALDARIRSKTLPAPGNWDFINVESVVALEPDLVILWAHQTEAIRALESRGLPVFGVFIQRFSDVHREIEALGMLTGTEARARELKAMVAQEPAWVQRTLQDSKAQSPPTVYFMWAQGDLETSGGPSTVNELIEAAGGRNAFKDLPHEHAVVRWENLLRANPDVVVMWVNSTRDPWHILNDARWRSVKAVQTGRVHELPDIFLCDLWTLKYPIAVMTVAQWLHPNTSLKEDIRQRRRLFLERLYNSDTVGRVADHAP
ncbi:ABC transporter substrate-binding protein [Desulfosoma caldarium]|uniref:Iron complex transport system substrate-binding protein n=1 Tax=Desulfosoma caldarium TaxID=610254 RepID=A0A3N1UR85_9BACT|nr:ABC transporter substrate-binding protein [Desulfosoma caldarium]ROQ92248.1 iron complex transport system substrate-binding protein [Desulfosoma caldarium]